MADYWGKAAIRQRMGWGSDVTLYRHIKRLAFPCYRRVDPRCPIRVKLYTNDQLIATWELARAKLYREDLMAREEERAEQHRQYAHYLLTKPDRS
jgi:hypothetical protein